jgi:outer membrane biosynthesis protein TonB
VTAAADPRLSGGILASVLLHGGLVGAFLLLRPPAPPPSPPLYQVHLIAAPPGPRAIGVVQDQLQPPVEKPLPPANVTPTRPTPAPPKAKVKPQPKVKAVTPTPTPQKAQPKTESPQPAAGGGETGGKGADVANVDTPGIEFPYPAYTNNIVRQLIIYLGRTAARDTAVVRFVIRRDGTIDPESIRPVAGSSYSFTQRALAAVEAAANAKVFGPLPPGFREDILPVTFRFTPALFR